MRVFSSYGSEDIDNAKDKGMIALNGFLKYCETKKIDRTIITNRQPDSDFEVSVMKLLSSHNFDCVPQVGEAGFFIDIAVKDQNKPGKFLMAIECDGATYHSSKTARDRDRLRQQILEGHGWKVRRIWSTDWFNNQNAAIKPIIDELKKLTKASEIEKKNDEMVDQIVHDAETIDEIYEVETVEMAEAQYLDSKINLVDTLNKFKKEVIEKEFPDTKIENKLLKPSMIEALDHFQPTNSDEFLESIPPYIRQNINSGEASQYLDSVLNIISSKH
jgi:very-short-patch-repair endonuclease